MVFLRIMVRCDFKQPRTITDHRRLDSIISIDALYKLCNTVPLSTEVVQQWCSMFAHVVRMTVQDATTYQPHTGRHNISAPHRTPQHISPTQDATTHQPHTGRHNTPAPYRTPLHEPQGFGYWHAQVHQMTESTSDLGQGQVTMGNVGEGLIAGVECLDYHIYRQQS